MSLQEYFPYPEYRPYQRDILDEVAKTFQTHDTVLLEAPTGFGKTGVAITLALFLRANGEYTHILASDKFLQEQYLTSHQDELRVVKGRNNFECSLRTNDLDTFFDQYKQTNIDGKEWLSCDVGPCVKIDGYDCIYKPAMAKEVDLPDYPEAHLDGFILRDKHGVIRKWDETAKPYCPYWVCKDDAIHNDITIHNYHYFLYESLYAREFSPRYLGIFDEAHNIEQTLMGFIEERFTKWAFERMNNYLPNYINTTIPQFKEVSDWMVWLSDMSDMLTEMLMALGGETDIGDTEQYAERKSIKDLVENYKERLKKVKQDIMYNPENWIIQRDNGAVTFKPVTIHQYANKYLFRYTKKRLLMSATILDPKGLARYLGLGQNVAFVRVPESTFPATNRPFYYDFVGKATYKNMQNYLPRMLKEIDYKIVPKHSEHKGVIHTHTNDIAKYIINNSDHRDIMMTNVFSPGERIEIFERFFDAEAPKIMVSASMNTGVDLYDDRCRWQVICKVPYPSLGDPQIKRRTKQDQSWYTWQTVMTIIQTYGRGCRSAEDWCDTFILDEKFRDIYSRNMLLFPKWFREAVRIVW
jgi:Rad3-related DNA helicase